MLNDINTIETIMMYKSREAPFSVRIPRIPSHRMHIRRLVICNEYGRQVHATRFVDCSKR